MSLFDYREQFRRSLDWYSIHLEKIRDDEENTLDESSKEIIEEELTKLYDYRNSLKDFLEGGIGPDPLKIFKSALGVYGKILEKNRDLLLTKLPGINLKKLEIEIVSVSNLVDVLNKS